MSKQPTQDQETTASFEDFVSPIPAANISHNDLMRAINELIGTVARIESAKQGDRELQKQMQTELHEIRTKVDTLIRWRRSVGAVSDQ